MEKHELTREIAKLQLAVESHEEQVKDLSLDLKAAKQKLTDVDKPKLTEKQFEAIQTAIEMSVENFTFDDADSKVELSHIEFRDSSDLAGEIYAKVEKLFGITDESDDTDSSECSVPSE